MSECPHDEVVVVKRENKTKEISLHLLCQECNQELNEKGEVIAPESQEGERG